MTRHMDVSMYALHCYLMPKSISAAAIERGKEGRLT
jgi:hypothetical protein